MAEAEDVITDAARHATVFAQDLWRRRRPATQPHRLALEDVASRLDLLAQAVFQRTFRLRAAQPPAPRTWLDKLLRRQEAPPALSAVPATDGESIWLPRHVDLEQAHSSAIERYRVLLLQQAVRATRGSAHQYPFGESEVLRALYHLFEADAADAQLVQLLPGVQASLQQLRQRALAARIASISPVGAWAQVEQMVRATLARLPAASPRDDSPDDSLARARAHWSSLPGDAQRLRGRVLVPDLWLGDFVPPPAAGTRSEAESAAEVGGSRDPVQAARLARRPQVRQPTADEDAQAPQGPMMVQTAEPHQQAEDPMGMQRPTDRDSETAAEEFADALSELPEARLVTSPAPAREVLLSDDAPGRQAASCSVEQNASDGSVSRYPEWDWRSGTYVIPGATVTAHTAAAGEQATVDAVFSKHALLLHAVRRQFELLRAQRLRLRQQYDGDDIDLQGWVDSQASLRSGGWLDQRIYEAERKSRRNMAVCLLVDISGSTDSWVSGQCRVIDVEREALLMVCIALEGLGEPFCVLGFSGEGAGGVVVRELKGFAERYSNEVALRIAGIEPEHYTRAGAALRHATAELMRQAAEHRLLIVLSDGRPNDVDHYDGRYGVEDLRQAVTEARLQGILPFCLTIDRQASNYLAHVFGHQYALLQRAELLPTVILNWLKQLISR